MRELTNLMLVAGGGAAGALARYGIVTVLRAVGGPAFPWGTLAVNGVGCFLVGIVLTRAAAISAADVNDPRAAFLTYGAAVGFLGALTTFSAFGWDTLRLIEENKPLWAAANVGANLFLGLFAVWLGRMVSV